MFHPDGPTLRELTAQALSSTETGYDLLAPKFDYTPFRTPDRILRAVAESLRAGPDLDWGLDLCCGTGVGMEMPRELMSSLSSFLGQHVPGFASCSKSDTATAPETPAAHLPARGSAAPITQSSNSRPASCY